MRYIRPPGRLSAFQQNLKQIQAEDHIWTVLKSRLGECPEWHSGESYDAAVALLSELELDASDLLARIWERSDDFPVWLRGITETDALFIFYDAAPVFRSELAGL